MGRVLIPHLQIGDKFHAWTIIEHTESNHFSKVRCNCGEERVLRNWNITNGQPSKCRTCYIKDKIENNLIAVGTKLESWEVISKNFERKKGGGGLKQEVRCKCGYTAFLELSPLKAGRTKKCLMCASRDRLHVYKDLIPIRYFNSIKKGALQRGYEFKITLEDAYRIYNKQKGVCALSGIPLNMPLVNLFRYHKSNRTTSSLSRETFTASIDRIDSNKGYLKSNIQWIHKKINIMKMDMSESEFFKYIKLIAEYKQL